MKKQWISVKCGLSRDPKHRQAMGESIWLFLHILDIASWDDGIAHDWKDEAAAEDMGMPVRTLREHRRKLDELGYISCNQKQYTQDIVIHNWTNPREYNGQVYNEKQGSSETSPKENVQGDTQGYIQGNRKDVTPTLYSKNQTSKRQLANTSIQAAIFGGMPITEEMMIEARLKDEAPKMFEAALGFSRPLAWTSDKDWTAFEAWVLGVYRTDPKAFERFETWRNTPYVKGSISNNRIRGFVNEFYDAWDMFKKQDAPQVSTSSMFETLS